MFGATPYAHTTFGGGFYLQAVLTFELSKADANANGLSVAYTPSGSVAFGLSLSTAQAVAKAVQNTATGVAPFPVSLADAQLSANQINFSVAGTAVLDVAKALSNGSPNRVHMLAEGAVLFAVSHGNVTAGGYPVVHQGAGVAVFDITKSDATATAYKHLQKVTWHTAKSVANALSREVSHIPTGVVTITVSKSDSTARGYSIDADYTPITIAPYLAIDRSADKLSCEVDLFETPEGQTAIRIYRASRYVGKDYEEIATVNIPDLPYSDTGLDERGSYGYKAKFIIIGTKGGQPNVVEGNPSQIRTTIGKNRSI